MRELSLKEVQEKSLELLLEFDEFCKEHEIHYYLGGGTLLGAVRHKGFIPWDDDTDVMLLRKDYEKLHRVIKNAELKPDRRFVHNRDKSFARHFVRYVRTDLYKEEEGFSATDCPWIGLDIFAVDYVYDDKRFDLQVKMLKVLRSLLLIGVTEENMGKNAAVKALKMVLRPIVKAYGVHNIAKSMEKIEAKYSIKNTTPYVAALSGMYGRREIWKYSDWKVRTNLEFEGHMLEAPANYDIYLSNLYGDYMQLPPEDKRKYTDSRVFEISSDSYKDTLDKK